MGLTLDKATEDMLGNASKVVISKNSTLIVTDGSTRVSVEERVSQIRGLIEVHFPSFTNIGFFNLLLYSIFYLMVYIT